MNRPSLWALAALSLLLLCATVPHGVHSADLGEYDIAIIGAGPSGLAVADYLRARDPHKKLRIALVDARDHVGGRTYTSQSVRWKPAPANAAAATPAAADTEDGAAAATAQASQKRVAHEFGFDFVSPHHLKLRRLMKRFQVPLEPMPPSAVLRFQSKTANLQGSTVDVIDSAAGKDLYVHMPVPDRFAEKFDIFTGLLAFWYAYRALDVEEWDPTKARLDSRTVSVKDWAAKHFESEETRQSFLTLVSAAYGTCAETEPLTMMQLLFFIRSADGVFSLQTLQNTYSVLANSDKPHTRWQRIKRDVTDGISVRSKPLQTLMKQWSSALSSAGVKIHTQALVTSFTPHEDAADATKSVLTLHLDNHAPSSKKLSKDEMDVPDPEPVAVLPATVPQPGALQPGPVDASGKPLSKRQLKKLQKQQRQQPAVVPNAAVQQVAPGGATTVTTQPQVVAGGATAPGGGGTTFLEAAEELEAPMFSSLPNGEVSLDNQAFLHDIIGQLDAELKSAASPSTPSSVHHVRHRFRKREITDPPIAQTTTVPSTVAPTPAVTDPLATAAKSPATAAQLEALATEVRTEVVPPVAAPQGVQQDGTEGGVVSKDTIKAHYVIVATPGSAAAELLKASSPDKQADPLREGIELSVMRKVHISCPQPFWVDKSLMSWGVSNKGPITYFQDIGPSLFELTDEKGTIIGSSVYHLLEGFLASSTNQQSVDELAPAIMSQLTELFPDTTPASAQQPAAPAQEFNMMNLMDAMQAGALAKVQGLEKRPHPMIPKCALLFPADNKPSWMSDSTWKQISGYGVRFPEKILSTPAGVAALIEPKFPLNNVPRVHFAGADTSKSWFGYVEGALNAGERAAAEVLHSICNNPALASKCVIQPTAAQPGAEGQAPPEEEFAAGNDEIEHVRNDRFFTGALLTSLGAPFRDLSALMKTKMGEAQAQTSEAMKLLASQLSEIKGEGVETFKKFTQSYDAMVASATGTAAVALAGVEGGDTVMQQLKETDEKLKASVAQAQQAALANAGGAKQTAKQAWTRAKKFVTEKWRKLLEMLKQAVDQLKVHPWFRKLVELYKKFYSKASALVNSILPSAKAMSDKLGITQVVQEGMQGARQLAQTVQQGAGAAAAGTPTP